jgi:hypothetical protein
MEGIMKKHLLFIAAVFALALFAACGSDDDTMDDPMQGDMGEHMQGSESVGMDEGNMQMMSSEEWVRSEPVDVRALDADNDGYVYQDPMDWNVIADQEGKCPECGMVLEKVTVEKAEQNLKDNGFKVEENG